MRLWLVHVRRLKGFRVDASFDSDFLFLPELDSDHRASYRTHDQNRSAARKVINPKVTGQVGELWVIDRELIVIFFRSR